MARWFPRFSGRRFPKAGFACPYALGALLFLFFAAVQTADFDLFNYLAFGRLFWSGAGVATTDPFSYVPTIKPWVHNEWLAGVLLYPLYETLGGTGVQALKYVLGLAALAFSLAAAKRRGASAWVWLAVFAACVVFWAGAFAPFRARVFSLFFFCLFAWLLEKGRETGYSRVGPALVVCMFLWANLHAGFWLGAVMMGLYALGAFRGKQVVRPLFLSLAAGLAATLANPYGFRLWTSTLVHAAAPDVAIQDWLPAWAALSTGLWFYGAGGILLGAAALAALFRDPDRDPHSLLLMGFLFSAALVRIRFVLYLAAGAAIYLPVSLARRGASGHGPGSRIAMTVLVLAAALMAAGDLRLLSGRLQTPGDYFLHPLALAVPAADETPLAGVYYPTGAVRHIRRKGLSGKVLPSYAWGSYLSWELYPRVLVAMDGRSQTVYPAPVRAMYWEFARGGKGFSRFLSAYPPDMVLLRAGSPAAAAMAGLPGWRVEYQSQGSVLFVPGEKVESRVAPAAGTAANPFTNAGFFDTSKPVPAGPAGTVRAFGKETDMPVKKELLEILACPKCKGPVREARKGDGLVCESCGLFYEVKDDIPVMIVEEARPAKEGE